MMLLHKNTISVHRNARMLFLLCLFLFHKSHAQEWELRKDKNGIKVYTRHLEDASIKEYKAVTIAKTSVEKALKVITDGNNLYKWNYKTADSKTIKVISETEFVFWMKNNLPWPVKNRDIISRIKVLQQENGTVTVTIAPEATHTHPQEKNTIRLKDFSGRWVLVPQGEHVEITQQMYGDPGGNLPSWVINALLTSAPYRTFLGLKEMLENQ